MADTFSVIMLFMAGVLSVKGFSMDFSKVRVDFSQAGFRVLGDEHDADAADRSMGSHSMADFSLMDASANDTLHGEAGIALAEAPQYRAVSLCPLRFGNDVLAFDFDPATGYCLAVQAERLAIWRQPSENPVFFPLPREHQLMARFLSTAGQLSRSSQPRLLLIDAKTGVVTYFDSVSQAVINPDIDPQSSDNGHIGRIELGSSEIVEHVEIVGESGLIAATNEGHLLWVTLRNDLGKVDVRATPMRHGSGFFSLLRSLGAFARDIVSIKAGRAVQDGLGKQEVYIVNKFGNIAVWQVSLNGISELVAEIHAGPKLMAQMDLLYPNSGVTLAVHDVAIEPELTHVLASFAPDSHSSTRVFVIVSFNLDFDVVSARRLQTYVNGVGEILPTKLHVVSGILVVITGDAFVMVDSPSKFDASAYTQGIPPPRWEECLYLKQAVTVLASKGFANGVVIGTNWDLISLTVDGLVFSHSKETAKVRLEQAVFMSSPMNPLDLAKWSLFEAHPDATAPRELAAEIANGTTPFLPKGPSLGEQLALRRTKMLDLFSVADLNEVREIAQALEAAVVLVSRLDQAKFAKFVNSCLEKIKPGSNLFDELSNDVLIAPALLESMASSNKHEVGYIVLDVLQVCEQDGLSVPHWATEGALKNCLETLTSQATDSGDVKLLETITDLLCSVYAALGTPDSPVSRNLLFKLSEMGSSNAIAIATKYELYSALAPLEVEEWLRTRDPMKVVEHIALFPEQYSHYLFAACISGHHSRALVDQIASVYPERVEKYLLDNRLPTIAWTLAPETGTSTEQLALASKTAENIHDRRLYASLYKISSHFTGVGSVSSAQMELDLVSAQESLAQIYSVGAPMQSVLIRHGIAELGKVLSRKTAVDLLALAPPLAVPEVNNNYITGFRLVDDDVHRNLLVQAVIINTNWERVVSAEQQSTDFMRKLKQTLYFHTLQSLSVENATRLKNFRAHLNKPNFEAVRKAFPWDSENLVFPELCEIAQRAQSIADKYEIDRLVSHIQQ